MGMLYKTYMEFIPYMNPYRISIMPYMVNIINIYIYIYIFYFQQQNPKTFLPRCNPWSSAAASSASITPPWFVHNGTAASPHCSLELCLWDTLCVVLCSPVTMAAASCTETVITGDKVLSIK